MISLGFNHSSIFRSRYRSYILYFIERHIGGYKEKRKKEILRHFYVESSYISKKTPRILLCHSFSFSYNHTRLYVIPMHRFFIFFFLFLPIFYFSFPFTSCYGHDLNLYVPFAILLQTGDYTLTLSAITIFNCLDIKEYDYGS